MLDKQEFVTSVYELKNLPKENLPEVVLCGRSNVGKSSFINSIFNRKNLAKTSSTPGKTRLINYYRIDDKFFVVDLPGYGYAKTSLKEREYWSKLIGEFFSFSKNIAVAFHFIDSRHKPTELDLQLNWMLRSLDIPYMILLSKVDKLKQSELSAAKKNIVEYFPEASFGDNLIYHSSIKKTGRKEIIQRFSSLFYKPIS